MGKQMTREEAFALLQDYNESDALIRHALAVESVMRHFAGIFEEDIEKWGLVGLIHDLDYEKYPELHCQKVVEILHKQEVDEEIIHAVASHGFGICSDVKPEHKMEWILYTIDELTGLIAATALMRPSKSILDLEYKSVQKKYKTSSFAAGVDRSVIENGCTVLGLELRFIIEETIAGMRNAAEAIGLKGEL